MKRGTLFMVILTVILTITGLASFADPLTNGDVIALIDAGLPDTVVVAKINQAEEVAFSLETDDLIALGDKMSGEVLAAMLKKSTQTPPTTTQAVTSAVTKTGASTNNCFDNFEESGSRMSGTMYKTHVVIENVSVHNAITAIAQKVALEGFQVTNTDVNLGIVSATQLLDSGKSMPLNITVRQIGSNSAEVNISLSLPPGISTSVGFVKKSFCEFIAAADPSGATSGIPESALPQLMDGETSTALTAFAGTLRKAGFIPVLLFYFDFDGLKANERTNDSQPKLFIPETKTGIDSWLIVAVKQSKKKGDIRYLKMGSFTKLAKMVVSGADDLEPDGKWRRKFNAEKTDGGWIITPVKNLKPGEYGVYDLKSLMFYGFGIDN